jgi:hypothetical protein
VLPGVDRIKTLPFRLHARDLARLAATEAQPARGPPLPSAARDVTEVNLAHASKPGQVTVGPDACQIAVEPGIMCATRSVRRRGAGGRLTAAMAFRRSRGGE